MSDNYDGIYILAKTGYNGDAKIWDRIYAYIEHHLDEFFVVTAPRKWGIAHQLVFHGASNLFQKVLVLYNEQKPVDIFSPTKDTPNPKTILDIATERKGFYPEQFEHITRLCAQDKFIRACKAYNWTVIDDMLQKDPKLLNQKPPYYSNYFVHILVLNKDVRKFGQYNLAQNRLQLDLENADKKTPLQLAREIGARDIVAEIESHIPNRFAKDPSVTKKSILTTASYRDDDDNRDERDDEDERDKQKSQPPTVSNRNQATGSTPPAASRSSGAPSTLTTGASASNRTAPNSTNSASTTTAANLISPNRPSTSSINPIVVPNGLISLATIPVSDIIIRVTCPLTGKIFVDPVIASDGLTYEHDAIKSHIRENRYSPATGEILDDIFEKNKPLCHLIEALRTEKLIQ